MIIILQKWLRLPVEHRIPHKFAAVQGWVQSKTIKNLWYNYVIVIDYAKNGVIVIGFVFSDFAVIVIKYLL